MRPKTDPTIIITTTASCLVTQEKKEGDTRFKRHTWEWGGRPNHVVIQFIGENKGSIEHFKIVIVMSRLVNG